MKKQKQYELVVDGITYHVFETTTNTKDGIFTVELEEKGVEDSHIIVPLVLGAIYSELVDSGECDVFADEMDSQGEHRTEDSKVEPSDVWEEFSENEKLEFVEDDLITAIRKQHERGV